MSFKSIPFFKLNDFKIAQPLRQVAAKLICWTLNDFFKAVLIGLTSVQVLALADQPPEGDNLTITMTERFWPVSCHPDHGLQSSDYLNSLQRFAGIDAVGATIKKAFIQKDKVIVEGFIYGFQCIKKDSENKHTWVREPLNSNESINTYLASSSPFPDFLTKIDSDVDHKFHVEANISDFFSAKDLRDILDKKGLARADFAIRFQYNIFNLKRINDRFSNSINQSRSPFFIFSYSIPKINPNERDEVYFLNLQQ